MVIYPIKKIQCIAIDKNIILIMVLYGVAQWQYRLLSAVIRKTLVFSVAAL